MRCHAKTATLLPFFLLLLLPFPADGGPSADGSPAEGPRTAHARTLARIGRTGLRSLLSASGGLGDLRNRAGSYRMAAQHERARRAPLEGRIEALEGALEAPGLSPADRDRLSTSLHAARSELAAVPVYEAAYETATVQAGALLPFGFLGDRPLFLLVRGRAHVRWGGRDGLTVLSEGASIGPVLATERWIVAPGLALGRTDVDIAPFDGRSGSTAAGPQLEVGRILGDRWAASFQVAHTWSRGGSTISRPGPAGPTVVESPSRSKTTSGKVEVKGRLPVATAGAAALSISPRLGVFLLSTRTPPTRNSLGETGTGPFGEREATAVVRAGADVGTRLGRWSSSLHLGWERELAHEGTALLDDPDAVLGSAAVGVSWGRGRRISIEYGLLRGLRGPRRVSELTVVAILDG